MVQGYNSQVYYCKLFFIVFNLRRLSSTTRGFSKYREYVRWVDEVLLLGVSAVAMEGLHSLELVS